MGDLHRGLADPGFTQPDGIGKYAVCKKSGKLAIDGVCPEVTSEYFAEGTQPSETCDLHETAVICKDSGLLAGEYCPEESKETRAFVKDSNNEDEKMPTEVCNIHTEESILDQILDQLRPEEGQQTGEETSPPESSSSQGNR